MKSTVHDIYQLIAKLSRTNQLG